MKFFESDHSFSHPWSLLTFANWRKYPNEFAPHVLSVDVLSRTVNPTTGALETQRLMRCKQPLPSFLKRMGLKLTDEVYFLETSTLDPKTQSYSASTVNLSLRSLMSAKETCVFRPDPSNPSEYTHFFQRAELTAMGVFPFVAQLMEDAAISRFQTNASKGKQALEHAIERLVTEAREVEHRVSDSIKEKLAGFASDTTRAI